MHRRRLRSLSHGGRSYVSEIRENADGTFDLIGVEILSTGGPIHGVGSPPEGDFWTLPELEGMAAADRELGDELMPPAKIGHPDEQVIVRNSIAAGELPQPADGEMPSVGWLEDVRVDGQRLLADVRKVPKLVKDLIEVGAYRTRSVELSKVTSQVSGKTYEWVVTGLAWLGGKMPAVKTLGDVVALYAGDAPTLRVFVDNRSLAVGDVIWKPERSTDAIRSELQEALNGPTMAGYIEPRWWVRDISLDNTAIVEDWTSDGDAFLVSFTVDDAGDVTPAPFSDWMPAARTWIEAAKDYEARRLTLREGRSDTGAMRYSAEQRRKFADATGLKADAVTDKMLEDAGVTAEEPKPDPEPTPDPKPEPTPTPEPKDDDEADRALEARLVGLEARNRALEVENHQAHRRSFVDAAIRSGKIAPGQRETLETLYDRDADAARKFVDDLRPREDLLSELGADDDEDDTRSLEDRERDYADDASARLGIPKDSIV